MIRFLPLLCLCSALACSGSPREEGGAGAGEAPKKPMASTLDPMAPAPVTAEKGAAATPSRKGPEKGAIGEEIPSIDPEIAGLMGQQATGAGVVHERIRSGSKGTAPFAGFSWPAGGKGGQRARLVMTLTTSHRQGAITLGSTRKAQMAGEVVVTPAGRGRTVEFRILKVDMSGKMFQLRQLPGASSPVDLRAMLIAREKEVAPLAGLARTFTCDGSGRVLRTGGSAPASMEWITGEITQVIEGVLRRLILPVPDGTLGVGASWSVTSGKGPGALRVDYALASLGRDGAKVTFRGKGLTGRLTGCPSRLALRFSVTVSTPLSTPSGTVSRVREVRGQLSPAVAGPQAACFPGISPSK